MEKRKFSDRAYTTLLWEFMQFAKQRVWDTSFAEATVQMLEKTGDLTAADGRALLARDEVLEVLQTGASGLFVDFLLQNPEILAEEGLLKWVQERQKNYPLT
jgi:hypothetical protein